MKTFIFVFSFLICSFRGFSQQVNGYVSGTLVVHEEFYEDGKISKRGYIIHIAKEESRETGLWTCFYPNGQKLSEDLRNAPLPKKYINCWTNTGKQICTNGNGIFLADADDLGWGGYAAWFTIKDSIRQGAFEVYTPYKNRKIKIAEGNYINGLIQGQMKYYYETGRLSTIQEYHDNKDSGWRKEFFELGKKLEGEGKWFNGSKDSVWTFYNYLGNMEKKITYIRGSNKVHVVEFYANGEKKAEGDYEYVHQKIEKKGDEYIEVKTTLLIPVKNGLWMYYSNTGVPSKKETYVNGELVK